MAASVLIADAQRLLTDALAMVLMRCDDLDILDARPQSGEEVIAVAVAAKPDVVVLDYWIEGSGPAVTREILSRSPHSKVLLMSWMHGANNVRDGLEAGAAGFLPKGLSVEQLHEAVHRAHEGEHPVFAEAIGALVHRIEEREHHLEDLGGSVSRLTARDLQILELVASGLSPEGIAKTLNVALSTIYGYLFNIRRKCGARSDLEAAAFARDQGLLT